MEAKVDLDEELREEHLAKVAGGARAPLNGIIAYTYNDGVREPGYEPFGFVNIGDCIQSLAARQYFPSVERCIDRDRLGEYAGEPVNVIMNAWYRLWRRNMVFSSRINPLLVSVHINNTDAMTDEALDYFRRHEPVGCRDACTVDFLRSKGIKAYFSGCLTLTLGRTYRVSDDVKREGVYFVDYQFGYDEAIDAELRKVLNGFRRRRKCYVRSHYYPAGIDFDRRMREAELIVKEYARAELVITRNIHCALPCLALGTPVIFLTPRYDSRRFSGLIGFFNRIGIDGEGRFVSDIRRGPDGRIVNPDKHLECAAYLEKIAARFGGGTFHGYEKGVEPVVPRRRYNPAERETGFWRLILQRRKCSDNRQLLVFGHIVASWRSRKA